MLNLDFTSKQTFLISLGLSLVVIGFLLFFASGIYTTERIDALANVIISNNSEARQLYDSTYEHILISLKITTYLSIFFILIGLLISIPYIIGFLENKVINQDNLKNKQKIVSLKGEIKELGNIWIEFIGEIFLIGGAIILGVYLIKYEIGIFWAIILIIGGVIIKRIMKKV